MSFLLILYVTIEKEVGDCDHFKHLELNHILCKKILFPLYLTLYGVKI